MKLSGVQEKFHRCHKYFWKNIASILFRSFDREWKGRSIMEKGISGYLGTYFNKNIVLRLASTAKVFSWIIVIFYFLQWFLQVVTTLLQVSRGFWIGMGFTDIAQNILWLFEQPLRGLVYFAVLQGMAQALLMFMDMEDNTRRATRSTK
jgi:hypothetical protein